MIAEIDSPDFQIPNLHLKLSTGHSMVEFKDGISIIVHFPQGQNLIGVQMVLDNSAAVNKLSGNRVGPLLIDFTAFTLINPLYTPTARTILLGSDTVSRRSAIAFLFNDQEQINKSFLFRSSNTSNIPLKMFTSREEAFLWMRTFTLN